MKPGRIPVCRGLLLVAATVLATGSLHAATPASKVYELDYRARFHPEEGAVAVELEVRQPRSLLRQVQFAFDPKRYGDFSADGELEVGERELTWRPPADGGRLRLTWQPDHRRSSGGYDSLLRASWAVFRGDDLLPPARVRSVKGARSKTQLYLEGPSDWSFATPYPKAGSGSGFLVERPDRSFDRPVGWMAAGRLGVRWETIADRKVAVAGPVGQGIRRLDMLAFMRWNLPELVQLFPDFPARLLVVSAGDPMWRGGLSGPSSLYIHAERPLISGNGTSTLLHELLHVAQSYGAERDEDWIVEGMAEFYTLELMRRSGTISGARARHGFERLSEWAEESDGLAGRHSTGARTARGVLVMQNLDREIRRRSDRQYSLDDVARSLAASGEAVSLLRLRSAAESLVGGPLESLSDEQLSPSE